MFLWCWCCVLHWVKEHFQLQYFAEWSLIPRDIHLVDLQFAPSRFSFGNSKDQGTKCHIVEGKRQHGLLERLGPLPLIRKKLVLLLQWMISIIANSQIYVYNPHAFFWCLCAKVRTHCFINGLNSALNVANILTRVTRRRKAEKCQENNNKPHFERCRERR